MIKNNRSFHLEHQNDGRSHQIKRKSGQQPGRRRKVLLQSFLANLKSGSWPSGVSHTIDLRFCCLPWHGCYFCFITSLITQIWYLATMINRYRLQSVIATSVFHQTSTTTSPCPSGAANSFQYRSRTSSVTSNAESTSLTFDFLSSILFHSTGLLAFEYTRTHLPHLSSINLFASSLCSLR